MSPTFKRALETDHLKRICNGDVKGWRSAQSSKWKPNRLAKLRERRTTIATVELRMLRHRRDFRRIIGKRIHAVIRFYLSNCPPEMIAACDLACGPLCRSISPVWAAAYCHDPSPQVRKHVAKALRRLEGWSLPADDGSRLPG